MLTNSDLLHSNLRIFQRPHIPVPSCILVLCKESRSTLILSQIIHLTLIVFSSSNLFRLWFQISLAFPTHFLSSSLFEFFLLSSLHPSNPLFYEWLPRAFHHLHFSNPFLRAPFLKLAKEEGLKCKVASTLFVKKTVIKRNFVFPCFPFICKPADDASWALQRQIHKQTLSTTTVVISSLS